MDVARQRKNAIAAYVVYVAVFYAILIGQIEPFASCASTFSLIGHLLTFPLYWIGLKIHTGEKRWPWVWFAITGVLYFLGDFFWAYYADWINVELESPSVCDVFYLLNSYTCCCAFICYIRQIKELRTGTILMDILISVLSIGSLLYHFIISPLIIDTSVGLFQMFFHANMSVIDLALFTGILAVIWGTEQSRFYSKRTLLLGLGFFLCCFVEQLSLAIEVYDLPISFFFEPFWTIPFWFFALTATFPDEDETDETERAMLHSTWKRPLQSLRIGLPYLFAAFILIFVGPAAAFENTAFFLVLFLTAIRAIQTLLQYARTRRTSRGSDNSQPA